MDPFDLKTTSYKVFSVLTDQPSARDDDRLLVYEIWSKETSASSLEDFFK